MADRNPLVLLHGIGDTSRIFKTFRLHFERRGWAVHALDLTPNDGDACLQALAAQVADYSARHFTKEQGVDLIGFSMGGLVARYYVQNLAVWAKVERLVTISSPHHGSWMAYLSAKPGVRQMRPGSVFLRDLERDRETLRNVKFTSIWTPFDLMILPANSSVVKDARMIRVPVFSHAAMLNDSRVLREVEQALRAS